MADSITLQKLELQAEGKDSILFELVGSGDIHYILKEGANYKFVLHFDVREPVPGLSYVSTTRRGIVTVDQKKEKLGSFEPGRQSISIPKNGWAKTITGPSVCGKYTVNLQLVDDEGSTLAEKKAICDIKEDW